jgi:Xaa-Pro aminopeptidase
MRYSIFACVYMVLYIHLSVCQVNDSAPFAKFGVYDVDGILPEEYHQRRVAVMAKMDSGSVAIFRANDFDNRNGDVDYVFRQNDNFLYLTGCNESNSTLVLIPDGFQLDNESWVKELLFVHEHTKSWAGDNLGIDGAKEVLGFGVGGNSSAAVANDKLNSILSQILQYKKILYYTPTVVDFVLDPVSEKKFVTAREVKKGLEEKYPGLTLKGSGAIINDLRAVKSQAELVFIQKAIDATVAGHIEAAKSCEPGMYEYQIQAVIDYCFTRAGCEYYGFPSIVGSGPNALSYHYEANRRQMYDGDLAVMDIGAEYHGYSADITRTLPVNGKYTPEQKVIYGLVLNAQMEAIKEIKPDAMMNTPSKRAMEVLGEGLVKLGIIKEKEDAKIYCPHGVSHFIGLNTHDVGSRSKLLPGMVLTMEPGLYFPDSSQCDKKYKGIGIRIEDDVLVTETGCRVLSEAAPKTVNEIEKLMKQTGIGNVEVGKK